MSSQVITLYLLFMKGVLSASIFQCPLNNTEWENKSKKFFCQGKEEYHCFLMEDTQSRRESCIEVTTLAEGYCPILTTTGYLHWSPCNMTGCPQTRYRSNEVYKYPICYGDIKENDNGHVGSQESEVNLGLILGLGIGIPFMLIALCITSIFVIARGRHNNRGNKTLENGNSEEIVELVTHNHEQDEFVPNGVAALVSGNLLYVVGKLGNSVSTTGKNIVTTFAKDKGMKPCFYHYLDIPKEFPSETVNFVDGWGGLWNHNPCEMQDAETKLKEIISYGELSTQYVKFVVGIRSDIKEKLRKKEISFREHETISLDNFSKSKQENERNRLKLTQTNCSNINCKCKSITMENLKDISFIGIPLMIELMDIDHSKLDIFIMEEKGPMKALITHINDIQANDKMLFNFILYIVLYGYYDQDDFKDEFTQAFGVRRELFQNFGEFEKLQKYTKTVKKSKLASKWTDNQEKVKDPSQDVLVFWHNFLYICAFHVCFKRHPYKMMQFCNIDALLQLLRPQGWEGESFTYQKDTSFIKPIQERIRGTSVENKWSEHPLSGYKTQNKKNFNRRKTHWV